MKKYILLSLIFLPVVLMAQRLPVGIVSVQDSAKSIQLGVISNIATDGGKGLQLSGFSNMSATAFRGIQLSGVSNIARGLPKGIQRSGLLNVSSDYMRGLQLGSVNYVDSLNGSQIGLVNVARTHPKGWQIGLVNITNDTIAHKIGLVNINPKTAIDFMIYGGTVTTTNFGIRFRNRSTYSIVGVGTHFMGLDKKFSGAVFYRLGQYFTLTPKLSLSGDIGFYHVETFQQHSNDTPERLFSLQARVNVDYRLTNHIGAFASVGWGTTRYYKGFANYRNRPLAEIGITIRQRHRDVLDNKTPKHDDREETSDSIMALSPKKHYWRAAAEVFGINAGVHLFDRFLLNEDFAQTTLHTIRHNFKTGFVWDNDKFATNMFAHPYHGNLYFNAARTNGLSFWESAPFSLGGSLMWEFFGETEPPAINDVIATTIGGITLGEITHRLSQLPLNDRSRGFRRFLREAAGFIINPIQGIHRIISGDAWRIRNTNYKYHDYESLPIDFSITSGLRYLADEGAMFRGEYSPYVNMYLSYGLPVDGKKHTTPYDFFDVDVTFGLSGNQPLVNTLNVLGRIWSTPILDKNEMAGEFGFYQHFNYYDSKPVNDGSGLTPYRISEAAALGPGFILSLPRVGAMTRLEQRIFLSGILLGGTKSDYFNVIDRDYNMGSGFSIKSKTFMELGHFGRLIMHAKYFHLFTWKGYEGKDLSQIDDLLYLNVQGDRGNAALLVVNPIVEVDLNHQWSLNFSGSYFYRKTHYKSHTDVIAKTYELKTSLTCHF